jgi:hypothetical protein
MNEDVTDQVLVRQCIGQDLQDIVRRFRRCQTKIRVAQCLNDRLKENNEPRVIVDDVLVDVRLTMVAS